MENQISVPVGVNLTSTSQNAESVIIKPVGYCQFFIMYSSQPYNQDPPNGNQCFSYLEPVRCLQLFVVQQIASNLYY